MKPYPIQLKAALKDYLWGGDKLKTEWGKETDKEKVAESWELSCHKDGESVVVNGKMAGKTLSQTLKRWKKAAGANARAFEMFPVLIKLIDAKQNLSVQVHPSDDFALQSEGQYGKTEMWYIVDAEPGAGIYYGFSKDTTAEEVRAAISENRMTDLLNFVEVKPGETYFIPSGTVHAICAGLTICEIQQNSNVTYRMYDYNRVGADGKPRELHLERALAVSNLSALSPRPVQSDAFQRGGAKLKMLSECKYFRAYEAVCESAFTGTADKDSFEALTFLSGEGDLDGLAVRRGDTVFVPAGYGEYTVTGRVKFLLTRV